MAASKALEPHSDSFYRARTPRAFGASLSLWTGLEIGGSRWALSSVVEHFVDIEGVTSSNLVVPTIAFPPVRPIRAPAGILKPEGASALDDNWRMT